MSSDQEPCFITCLPCEDEKSAVELIDKIRKLIGPRITDADDPKEDAWKILSWGGVEFTLMWSKNCQDFEDFTGLVVYKTEYLLPMDFCEFQKTVNAFDSLVTWLGDHGFEITKPQVIGIYV